MSTFSRSTHSTISVSGKNDGDVPSYMRGTKASNGKRRTKVVHAPRPEPTLPRDGVRPTSAPARKRMVEDEDLERYQRLTKAAKAKVASRSYVLQGVRVQVPQIAICEYEASEEDKVWQDDLIQEELDKMDEVLPEVDSLFVGRHTYRNALGRVVARRSKWKENYAKKTGVEWNEFRICRNYGLNIEDFDDDVEE